MKDHSLLRAYLERLAPLDDEEWRRLESILHTREFDKKEFFQTAGRPCRHVGFLLEGCFRWVRTIDGNERTFDFAIENEFVTDYVSILSQKPGTVDIVAVERSTVLCVEAAQLLALFDSSFTWQKIGRHLAEGAACYTMERLEASYYETPRMRYDRLMKDSPELFLRIPLHILANYLGVTQETLSRLRHTK